MTAIEGAVIAWNKHDVRFKWALCGEIVIQILTMTSWLCSDRWWIWVDFAVLIGYIILFNAIVMLFLSLFGRAPMKSSPHCP